MASWAGGQLGPPSWASAAAGADALALQAALRSGQVARLLEAAVSLLQQGLHHASLTELLLAPLARPHRMLLDWQGMAASTLGLLQASRELGMGPPEDVQLPLLELVVCTVLESTLPSEWEQQLRDTAAVRALSDLVRGCSRAEEEKHLGQVLGAAWIELTEAPAAPSVLDVLEWVGYIKVKNGPNGKGAHLATLQAGVREGVRRWVAEQGWAAEGDTRAEAARLKLQHALLLPSRTAGVVHAMQ